VRVESRSASHRPSRLGHVGAHDGLLLDGDWASDTFFSVTDRQKRDYLSRASATKNHKADIFIDILFNNFVTYIVFLRHNCGCFVLV